jgi:mRNA-degrading endonuclease toxin of MazEF toxin-antitoxin module
LRLRAGQIVVVDWRDGLPKEANKRRPAVVVEDTELFDPSFPNVLLVPLTDDLDFAVPALSGPIDPTPENGCSGPCRALAHGVTATSKRRVRPTESTIGRAQLDQIRHLIGVALGLS